MYLIGKGSDVMGPGTAMVQRIDWDRASETNMRGGFVDRGTMMNPGMGGCRGMGCGCAGGCMAGLGLFDSMDFTTWGWPEWGIVALGGYMVLSTVSSTGRSVRGVRKTVQKYRSRRAVAA